MTTTNAALLTYGATCLIQKPQLADARENGDVSVGNLSGVAAALGAAEPLAQDFAKKK